MYDKLEEIALLNSLIEIIQKVNFRISRYLFH